MFRGCSPDVSCIFARKGVKGIMDRVKESKPFYHTAAWKKCRKAVMMRDGGMCVDCMERFRAGYGAKPRRATMVHHVVPYEDRPDLGLNADNLVSLCSDCHAKRHPEKGGHGSAAGTDPRSTKMRVIKV